MFGSLIQKESSGSPMSLFITYLKLYIPLNSIRGRTYIIVKKYIDLICVTTFIALTQYSFSSKWIVSKETSSRTIKVILLHIWLLPSDLNWSNVILPCTQQKMPITHKISVEEISHYKKTDTRLCWLLWYHPDRFLQLEHSHLDDRV